MLTPDEVRAFLEGHVVPRTPLDICVVICAVMEAEIDKASAFAERSLKTLQHFFVERSPLWRQPGANAARTKESIRYLHHEVTHLSTFVDTNKLCVLKLCKKYDHALPPAWWWEKVRQTPPPPPNPLEISARLTRSMEGLLSFKQAIEMLYATLFEGGDIGLSHERIRAGAIDPEIPIRIGFMIGIGLALVFYWLHVLLELGITDWLLFQECLPVLRL
jgi:hypothetical protein